MENIKQQIEEINQSIAEINQARDRTVEYFKNKIKQLEQQVNKPKIEVGKVYKDELGSIIMITSIELKQIKGFRIVDESWYDCRNTDSYYGWVNDTKMVEATKEEWETALTKHADKLYEGVKKVDRSGMDILWSDIESFKGHLSTVWNGKEFQYKGIFVMDKHGVWAKPVIEEKEMFVNVHLVDGDNSCGTIYYDASEAKNSTTGVFKHLGVFKLVKVG